MYRKKAEIIFEENTDDAERIHILKTLVSLGLEFMVEGDYIDGTHYVMMDSIPDLTDYLKG